MLYAGNAAISSMSRSTPNVFEAERGSCEMAATAAGIFAASNLKK